MKRQVRGYLPDDVPDRETSVDLIQLVPHEAQLLLHTGDIGVGEIRPIELLHRTISEKGRSFTHVTLTGQKTQHT